MSAREEKRVAQVLSRARSALFREIVTPEQSTALSQILDCPPFFEVRRKIGSTPGQGIRLRWIHVLPLHECIPSWAHLNTTPQASRQIARFPGFSHARAANLLAQKHTITH